MYLLAQLAHQTMTHLCPEKHRNPGYRLLHRGNNLNGGRSIWNIMVFSGLAQQMIYPLDEHDYIYCVRLKVIKTSTTIH
jgi:hypothetical protein